MYRQVLTVLALISPSVAAADRLVFQPDPAAVQRIDKGYRYPRSGWTVVHIEGSPYARGYQHGRLMAPEIDRFIKTLAQQESAKAPDDGWRRLRTLTGSLFLHGFAPEYLEEMKGIADGATAGGAKAYGNSVELIDIAAVNCWPEVYTLDAGLEAWPTGLEGKRFRDPTLRSMPAESGEHCSAFAAVGPATTDGKVVFGHVTMFGLHLANHFNLWIDIVPEKGRRLVMQTFPGGIHSGTDYYMNDAGILMAETTFKQTRFDPKGRPLASRVRQAMQYGESIEQVCETLKTENNGLYANEWILADINRNEIALFLLGTHQSKLIRSSKNEWFGGTEGFYWSCNTIKDMAVRLESIPGTAGRPHNVAWRPSDRDVKWQALYQQHKGKIDADFGKLALSTTGLAKSTALDAKVTTAALAKQLHSWALFGPPHGWLREPTPIERSTYTDIRALTPNPWTTLANEQPTGAPPTSVRDVPERSGGGTSSINPMTLPPAWHGTILPKTPSDVWLATGFAEYERIMALELHFQEKGWKTEDREQWAQALAAHRKSYLQACLSGASDDMSQLVMDRSDHWYQLASGKGVMMLHLMREAIGATEFMAVMDSFGRQHAGQEVSAQEFQQHLRDRKQPAAADLVTYLLSNPGLPTCSVDTGTIRVDSAPAGFQVHGIVRRPAGTPNLNLDVTIETPQGDEHHKIKIDQDQQPFQLPSKHPPRRVIIDPWGTLQANNAFGVKLNIGQLENALIIYATGDNESAHRIAAGEIQKAVQTRGPNILVPIRSDKDVANDEVASKNLILVGRPAEFQWSPSTPQPRFATFGTQSFAVGRDTFAHPGSAIVTVVPHPTSEKLAAVLVAGNSGEATIRAAASILSAAPGADTIVLPHRGKDRVLVGVDATRQKTIRP